MRKEKSMRKKNSIKITSMAICFCFLIFSFPGKAAAKKNIEHFNVEELLKEPLIVISSFISGFPFNNIFLVKIISKKNNENKEPKDIGIGTQDGLNSGRPSGGN